MWRVVMLNHNRRPHNTDAPLVVADIRGHVCTPALKGFREKARHSADRRGACLGRALVHTARLIFHQDTIRTDVEIKLRHDGTFNNERFTGKWGPPPTINFLDAKLTRVMSVKAQ